jgi:hypothetical protein
MLFIGWTLCQICLFEFIRAEEGVKFMEPVKGAQAIKVLKALHYTDWAIQGTFRKQVYSVHCSWYEHTVPIHNNEFSFVRCCILKSGTRCYRWTSRHWRLAVVKIHSDDAAQMWVHETYDFDTVRTARKEDTNISPLYPLPLYKWRHPPAQLGWTKYCPRKLLSRSIASVGLQRYYPSRKADNEHKSPIKLQEKQNTQQLLAHTTKRSPFNVNACKNFRFSQREFEYSRGLSCSLVEVGPHFRGEYWVAQMI